MYPHRPNNIDISAYKQSLYFRPRSILTSLLAVALLLAFTSGLFEGTALAQKKPPHKQTKVQVKHKNSGKTTASNPAVLTTKNDLARTGQNTNETLLNTSNVNSMQFGKHVAYSVDGQFYAQPLYVPNLTIGTKTYNVVFAATQGDSVYAFDADQTSNVAPLWHDNLTTPH